MEAPCELKALYRTVSRLNDIMLHIKSARDMPGEAKRRAGRLSISSTSYYGGPSDEDKAACARLAKMLEAELVAEAEADRDQRLRNLAAEIDSLRAVLPSLAASAAVSLGSTILEIRP